MNRKLTLIHSWLMKNPTHPFCSRPGRAAARPYHIGPGRDALLRVRGVLDGFMSQSWILIATALTFLAATCHADELADKGRDIFKKNRLAVVTVQVVLKMTSS